MVAILTTFLTTEKRKNRYEVEKDFTVFISENRWIFNENADFPTVPGLVKVRGVERYADIVFSTIAGVLTTA